MNIDEMAFRRVMGHLATGVTVVTTKLDSTYHGLTVNSFTSVSLDPLLILVNIAKHAVSHDMVVQSGIYAVNFLSADQEQVSVVFADSNIKDRFAFVTTSEGLTGAPIIEGSMAYIEAHVRNVFDAGDHSIFLGEVVAMNLVHPEKAPLLYYRGNYAGILAREPEDLLKQVPRV